MVEYWQPDDGSYHADSIKEKVPMYLWGKAMNSQRYVDKQSAKLEKLAKEHFGITASDPGSDDASAIAAELIPGTTYVSRRCLYMNPLSSYAAIGGDSGCKYVIGENSFTTIYRRNENFVSVIHPDLETAGDNGNNIIAVPHWQWQTFPYTDAEWAALYVPQGIGRISNISEICTERICRRFLTTSSPILRTARSV